MVNNPMIILNMTHQSKFSIGDNVQILDLDEQPLERAIFVISYRFLFLYRLSRVNSTSHFSFWVRGNEITLIKSSKSRN